MIISIYRWEDDFLSRLLKFPLALQSNGLEVSLAGCVLEVKLRRTIKLERVQPELSKIYCSPPVGHALLVLEFQKARSAP